MLEGAPKPKLNTLKTAFAAGAALLGVHGTSPDSAEAQTQRPSAEQQQQWKFPYKYKSEYRAEIEKLKELEKKAEVKMKRSENEKKITALTSELRQRSDLPDSPPESK
jgi:hypothetical protein